MGYWPQPKVIEVPSVDYIYRGQGTYTVSGERYMMLSGHKVEGERHEYIAKHLRFWPVYLHFILNKEARFGIGVCGNHLIFGHIIHLCVRWRFWPVFVIRVTYGWTKIWWKPWAYLKVFKGGPNG